MRDSGIGFRLVSVGSLMMFAFLEQRSELEQ